MDEIKDPLLEAIEVSDQRHETGIQFRVALTQ
jgi:hypothetical protein